MAGFYDVYVDAPARTAEAIRHFLDLFVPSREPAAFDYPVPDFSDEPTDVFLTPDEVITWCIDRPSEGYGLYWRSTASEDPAYAMAFFTNEGGLILGLSVLNEPERWLSELRIKTGGHKGWISFEEPPMMESQRV